MKLHERPKDIDIGEVKGVEVLNVSKALESGPNCSFTTIHALPSPQRKER